MSPEESALRAAVAADPDNDLPRLVLADWLEESGRAPTAEFIRVQCALARDTHEDADHCDLLERETELQAIHGPELTAPWPELPPGWLRGAVRRGFLEEVVLQGQHITPTAELPAQFEAVAATTPLTACQLNFVPGPGWDLLRHSVAERLRSLDFSHTGRPGSVGIDALCDTPHLRHLRELEVFLSAADLTAVARLVTNPRFADLTAFRFSFLDLAPPKRPLFAAASWREHLAELVMGPGNYGQYPQLVGRAAFPGLTHLTVYGEPTADLAKLLNDAARYPALSALTFDGSSDECGAQGVMDRPLRSVRRTNIYHDPAMGTFLSWPALRTVRSLELSGGSRHTDGWSERIARPGVFGELRHLHLNSLGFDAAGLRAFATAPFWETVTSLRLDSAYGGAKPDDWATFLRSLHAPALRHLRFSGYHLNGSKIGLALAGNRSLGQLRLLQARNAKLGKKAHQAILTAPQFQQLLVLDLHSDQRQEGFEPLADPAVLPRAQAIRLGRVTVPPEVAEKLRARGGVHFAEKK